LSDENIAIGDKIANKFKDTKEYKELIAILIPMIQSIRSSPSSRKILNSCAKKMIERSEIQQKRILLLRKTFKLGSQDEVQILQNALFYLGYFEISVTNILDQLIMIFIANNHDFYIFRKKGYAKKFEDLDKAFLSEKLDFLKHHEIDLPVINNTLRNKIAHMDFDISNGKVIVNNYEYDLKWETFLLSAFVIAFATILKDAHFPEIIQEISKENLEIEKKNAKLVF